MLAHMLDRMLGQSDHDSQAGCASYRTRVLPNGLSGAIRKTPCARSMTTGIGYFGTGDGEDWRSVESPSAIAVVDKDGKSSKASTAMSAMASR